MILRNTYFILFSFILILSLGLTNNIMSYIVFLIIIFIFLVEKLIVKKVDKIDYISFIPLSLLMVWLYGFTLGILNGNETIYVIRNFAGLLLYSLYFVLISKKFSVESIIQFILYVSLLNIFIGLYYAIGAFNMGKVNRLIFLGNMTTYFIPFSWAFFNLFAPVNIKKKTAKVFLLNSFNSFIILILSALVILASSSKGFIFGLLVLTFSLIIFLYKNNIFSYKTNVKLIYIYIFLFISFYVLYYYNFTDLILLIFNVAEESNNFRYHQFFTLVNDLTIFGKGLGSVVLDNNTGNSYGFELVYINIMHKFGIVSILIFISIIFTLYWVIKRLNEKKDFFILLISFSCMIYLIPSLGNPILFAPINVLLHVFVLSIIYKLDKKEKKYV